VLHLHLLRVKGLDLFSMLVSLEFQVLNGLVLILDLSDKSFLILDRKLLIFLDSLLRLSKTFFKFDSGLLRLLELLSDLFLLLLNTLVELEFMVQSGQSLSQMVQFEASLCLLAQLNTLNNCGHLTHILLL
jgi:hypothetical protein